MRLLGYLEKQGADKDSNKFRMLSLKLVKTRTKHEETVKKISEEYDLDTNYILGLRELLNKDLKKKGYRGPNIFDFVLDEGSGIEDIKLENRKKDILKRRHFELESKLAEVQKKFEKKLKQVYK
jgi:hypothetical protein